MLRGTIIFVAIVVLLIAVVIRSDPVVTPAKTTNTTDNSPPPAPRWQMRDAIANVGLEFQWSKSEVGIMTAHFTIDNKNDYDVKDLEIRCVHSGPSGTTIDTNTRTIYEVFRARSKRTIRNFNMGFVHNQAHKSGCGVMALAKGEERAPAPAAAPKNAQTRAKVPTP